MTDMNGVDPDKKNSDVVLEPDTMVNGKRSKDYFYDGRTDTEKGDKSEKDKKEKEKDELIGAFEIVSRLQTNVTKSRISILGNCIFAQLHLQLTVLRYQSCVVFTLY